MNVFFCMNMIYKQNDGLVLSEIKHETTFKINNTLFPTFGRILEWNFCHSRDQVFISDDVIWNIVPCIPYFYLIS